MLRNVALTSMYASLSHGNAGPKPRLGQQALRAGRQRRQTRLWRVRGAQLYHRFPMKNIWAVPIESSASAYLRLRQGGAGQAKAAEE